MVVWDKRGMARTGATSFCDAVVHVYINILLISCSTLARPRLEG